MDTDHHVVDERQLLEELVSGDAEAFSSLYYRYGGSLHAHLLRMTKSEEVAQEIFQDIFMKIWERRAGIDTDKPFAAYLYRIAVNKVYDHFRKIAREKRLADEFASFSEPFHRDTENGVLYHESLRLIHHAIDRLPPVRRQIYILSKLEHKSYDEIAALLGISTSTINDHIVKANRFLKKALATHIDTVVVWLILFGM